MMPDLFCARCGGQFITEDTQTKLRQAERERDEAHAEAARLAAALRDIAQGEHVSKEVLAALDKGDKLEFETALATWMQEHAAEALAACGEAYDVVRDSDHGTS